MGARVLIVKGSAEEIIPNRPQKPVKGRRARIAAYREQRRQATVPNPEEAARPRKPAVVEVREPKPGKTPAPPVASTSPGGDAETVPEQTYWPARHPHYPPRDTIPYCLDQP